MTNNYELTCATSTNSFSRGFDVKSIEDFGTLLDALCYPIAKGPTVIGWSLKSCTDDGTLGGEYTTSSEFDGVYTVSSDRVNECGKYLTCEVYVFDGVVYDNRDKLVDVIEAEGFAFSDFF